MEAIPIGRRREPEGNPLSTELFCKVSLCPQPMMTAPFPSQRLCRTCPSKEPALAHKIMNHKFYFKM
jgi:hypothetical protein